MPVPISVMVTHLIVEAKRDGEKRRLKKLKSWRDRLQESGEWDTGHISTIQ